MVAVELGDDLELEGDWGAMAVELDGDCGAVAGRSTAAELQATVVRVTEIPNRASLIRDQVNPAVEIGLRWALLTSRLTPALAGKFPINLPQAST